MNISDSDMIDSVRDWLLTLGVPGKYGSAWGIAHPVVIDYLTWAIGRKLTDREYYYVTGVGESK